MRARLADAGWAEVDGAEGADVVVVNTCTVTARADQEARQLVRSLARRSPSARIVVTGCYAQRAPGEVAAIDGVSLVLGVADDGVGMPGDYASNVKGSLGWRLVKAFADQLGAWVRVTADRGTQVEIGFRPEG